VSFTPLENVAVENCVGKRKIKLNFSAQKKRKEESHKVCNRHEKKCNCQRNTKNFVVYNLPLLQQQQQWCACKILNSI